MHVTVGGAREHAANVLQVPHKAQLGCSHQMQPALQQSSTVACTMQRMQHAPAMHWKTACNIHHALYTTALGTHRRGHAAMRYGRLACQACAPPPTWSRPAHGDLPQRSPCRFCLERTCTRRQDGAQGCRMIGCSAPVAAATVSGVTRRAARAPCKPRDAMITILRQSMRRLRPTDTSVRASEVRMIRPAAPIFVGRAYSRRQRLQGPQPHRGRACNDLREAHRRPVASVPLMSPVSSPLINRIAKPELLATAAERSTVSVPVTVVRAGTWLRVD